MAAAIVGLPTQENLNGEIDKLSEEKVNNESDATQRRRRKRGFDVGPGEGWLLFEIDAANAALAVPVILYFFLYIFFQGCTASF